MDVFGTRASSSKDKKSTTTNKVLPAWGEDTDLYGTDIFWNADEESTDLNEGGLFDFGQEGFENGDEAFQLRDGDKLPSSAKLLDFFGEFAHFADPEAEEESYDQPENGYRKT